jgi:methionyl-tRNA synthetase
MYSMVIADVLKRWQTLKGNKALLCTGTDEHGLKIQRAAAQADKSPKEFCDITAQTFKSLAELSQIDYDFFIRTTDEDHAEAVKHFWFLLKQKGFIYESKHEGWYCISDEAFYAEDEVERAQDKMTGKVHMASKQSGHPVEWTEEKNYHFRMSSMKDRLLEFYAQNPQWITPASKMNEVKQWVTHNLEDLSISRPATRLTWGIPVPGDPSQTIYVWLDALINYITKAGFPNWPPGHESDGGWPVDVHVIGKDILRFHCVYWPALLLALDLPLPRSILCHAHWTMNRQKMSKSLGNAVNPLFAIDRFGIDTMRLHLMHESNVAYDSDYSNFHIIARYSDLLKNGLGNLLSRVTRSKDWNVADAVTAAHAGQLGKLDAPQHDTLPIAKLADISRTLPADATGLVEQNDPFAAVRRIFKGVTEVRALSHDISPKCELLPVMLFEGLES